MTSDGGMPHGIAVDPAQALGSTQVEAEVSIHR